jgi:hypothetical protein
VVIQRTFMFRTERGECGTMRHNLHHPRPAGACQVGGLTVSGSV